MKIRTKFMFCKPHTPTLGGVYDMYRIRAICLLTSCSVFPSSHKTDTCDSLAVTISFSVKCCWRCKSTFQLVVGRFCAYHLVSGEFSKARDTRAACAGQMFGSTQSSLCVAETGYAACVSLA